MLIKVSKLFILVLLLVGFSACAGIADYQITLIRDYDVVRTSSESIFIAKRIDETSHNASSIPVSKEGTLTEDHPEYVTQVAHDYDRYILAKTDKDLYYILDTTTEEVYGELNLAEFTNKKKELGISESIILKDLSEYDKEK